MNKKAFVVGSVTKSKQNILDAVILFSKKGYDVSRPIWPEEASESEYTYQQLVSNALLHIQESDLVIIVPKNDGTFGEGTTCGYEISKLLNKDIVIWTYLGNEQIVYSTATITDDLNKLTGYHTIIDANNPYEVRLCLTEKTCVISTEAIMDLIRLSRYTWSSNTSDTVIGYKAKYALENIRNVINEALK